jgi:two-component system response regulator AtoC
MKMAATSILAVEDDPGYRELLELALEEEGYKVATVANYTDARHAFEKSPYALVICDLRLPGKSGIELIRDLKQRAPETGFILLTALGIRGQVVQAMKDGVDKYLVKGAMTPDTLLQAVHSVLEQKRLRENQEQNVVPGSTASIALIGQSAAIRDILNRIERVATFRSPILITGETGTGKEAIARAIHDHSLSRERQFATVQVASLPSSMLDSELFGYVKGAFPGADNSRKGVIEDADGGTVFFDDIADLPQPLQPKIHRVLQQHKLRRLGDSQEKAVDVRIVCATSHDLWAMSREGTFREDLLQALNVVHIHVPPLRDRCEDIPVIADWLFSKINQERDVGLRKLSPEALKILMEYAWPGNVRELESVLERAAVLTEGPMITPEHLPEEVQPAPQGVILHIPEDQIRLKDVLRELTQNAEIELIHRALAKTDNNRTHAAKLLGISHRSLLYKLKEYNIR